MAFLFIYCKTMYLVVHEMKYGRLQKLLDCTMYCAKMISHMNY